MWQRLRVIEAEGLTKIYNKTHFAVNHISFSVEDGEVFGFLGPNGAGKTTTIKMLTTLTKPTEGRASVCGVDVRSHPEKVRSLIGLVPQELTVDDDLTGVDNLMLQAKLYRLSGREAEARINELLDLVGLRDFARRVVKTYSGGMRKRLELIGGLIHRPRLLFLDEPTLGLDVQTRAIIWDYIHKLNREEGITIFLTTHYMDEADQLCDRIAIIDHGQIVKAGTPSELKDSLGGDVIEVGLADDRPEISVSFAEIINVHEVKKVGGVYRVKVSRGEEALPLILGKLLGAGVQVKRVSLVKPSLDQVFLEYTGRSLRDEQQGAEDFFRTRFVMRRLRAS
ncbi:MAG: ATP-binding cassette domain-containing protein [Candidatus Bathyarchaeia archaeon]